MPELQWNYAEKWVAAYVLAFRLHFYADVVKKYPDRLTTQSNKKMMEFTLSYILLAKKKNALFLSCIMRKK